MAHYTAITIIYNPNSTGASEKLARDMQAKLRLAKSSQKVTLAPTKHAGHAIELAFKLAKQTANPLIISASGDGGYHEVVNGLMRAQAEGARPVAGLLPAGNANDHFHNVHQGDFIDAVVSGQERRIDLLKLSTTCDAQTFERYAHSYIGLGLSSKASRDLNNTRSKRFNDVAVVLRSLWKLKPVRLEIGGEIRAYDSLIFSNINKMSKVLALSHDAKADDGKFEITAVYGQRIRLIGALLKAATTGLSSAQQADSFTFRTVDPTLVQLDGEVIKVDADIPVSVTLEPAALRCIV